MKSLLAPRPDRLLCAALAFALLASCAVNPVSGRQNLALMTEADEIRTGRQADADVKKQYGVYDLPRLQEYVDAVGKKLAKNSHRSHLEFHFTVVDSPEINAFALPGGYIYITRGILAYLNSEAELAAVLGHEIGHVTARHSVQQYSAAYAADIAVSIASVFVPELGSNLGRNLVNVIGNALLSGYGRDHELEADRLGAEYLAKTGYDPQAMVQVIRVLKNQEVFDAEIAKQEGREPRRYHGVFATHPDNDTRLQQVVGEAEQWAKTGAGASNRGEFLAQSNGVTYGDDPHQGVVRGSAFYHAELNLGLKFPEDWHLHNLPDKLAAESADHAANFELSTTEFTQQTALDMLRKQAKPERGDEVLATTVNGLPAALATLRKTDSPQRVAVITLNNRGYQLNGSAGSLAAFDRHLAGFNGIVQSFHALSEAERKLGQPLSLVTIQAKPGTTFAQLAKSSPLGKNAEGILRLLNAMYPSGEPVAGDTVKVVE